MVEVVVVEVCIAQGVHENTGLQIAYLGHHVGEQGVRCNVEGNAQEHVGAPLVKLTVQASLRHMELEKCMAWHQRHVVKFPHVPRRDDDSSTVRIGFDALDGLLNLVDDSAVFRLPPTPLLAVHGPQVAVFIRPLVPDANAVFLQVLDVGIALEEPEQFVDDGGKVQLLGGDHRKSVCKVKSHLVTKH